MATWLVLLNLQSLYVFFPACHLFLFAVYLPSSAFFIFSFPSVFSSLSSYLSHAPSFFYVFFLLSYPCFYYLFGTTVTNQNAIQEEIKSRLKSGNACFYSVQSLLTSSLLSKNMKINIYRTIILPVVLYGCETWSLTLREERRLRRIFGSKRDAVTGEWRKLHNEELNDLYCSPNIVRVIKWRTMGWAVHVEHVEEGRGVHRVLVKKQERKRPLGRPRRRWNDNIKIYIQDVGCRDWTVSIWVTIGTGGGLL